MNGVRQTWLLWKASMLRRRAERLVDSSRNDECAARAMRLRADALEREARQLAMRMRR